MAMLDGVYVISFWSGSGQDMNSNRLELEEEDALNLTIVLPDRSVRDIIVDPR